MTLDINNASCVNDEDVINSILSGNKDDYKKIVKKYQNLVFSVAASIVGNFHIAEEITQDTFVYGYMHLSKVRDKSRLRSWLCTMARNKAYNVLSRNPELYAFDILEEVADTDRNSPEEFTIKRQDSRSIASAIGKLSKKIQTVVVMFYFQNYSLKKISEVLDIPEGTVKRRLYDARKILKEELDYMIDKDTSMLTDDFTKQVMDKINNLHKHYFDNEFVKDDKYERYYNEIISLIERMPETKEKHSAYADAYLMKAHDDKEYYEKALAEAEKGGNAGVISEITIKRIISSQDHDFWIKTIDETIITMEKLKAVKEKGELLFWKGAAYHNKGELQKAKEVFLEAISCMDDSQIYKANAKASVKIIDSALKEKDLINCYVVSCGEGLAYENGTLIFKSQPGYSLSTGSSSIGRFSSLFYHVSRVKRIFFNDTMKVGDEIVSKKDDEGGTLKVLSTSDKITVLAGTFENCLKLELSKDFNAQIWYARGIGLVCAKFTSFGIEEQYELSEYRIKTSKDTYMPLEVGNLWKYKNVDLPDFYNQNLEKEIVYCNEEQAYFASSDHLYLSSDVEKLINAPSKLFIELASTACEKWDFDKAIYYLKLAAQKNTDVNDTMMALAGIEFLTKQKGYYDKKYRFLPSSVNGDIITKFDDHLEYSESYFYNFGPYRWGSRHEENKIFGTKILRYLSIANNILFDNKWVDGFTEVRKLELNEICKINVQSCGKLSVKAGTFDNCIKITLDIEKADKNAKNYYWDGHRYVHCGKKDFYLAPNVGVVKFDCIWDDTLSSICELSKYTTVATNGEYFPVCVGNSYTYDEMTLEEGYVAQMSYSIKAGKGNSYFVTREQDFVYLGTEEDYEIMKKNIIK